MLIPFWFNTSTSLGYGVTAASQDEAMQLLSQYGYPHSGDKVTTVILGVTFANLDQSHVVPNAGPMTVRGVWFPMHNV